MTVKRGSVDPYAIVAEALNCPRDSLSIESEMYRTHGWDSFGQVCVVSALERALCVEIPNEQMLELTSMKAIISFTERHIHVDQNDAYEN